MNTLKIKSGLLYLFSAIVLFTSCKEDRIDTFDGETNVYFSLKRWGESQNGRSYSVVDFPVGDSLYSGSWSTIKEAEDSLIVSLALDGTDEGFHLTLIPVSIAGNIADYDRPLKYTLGGNTTAVEGEHFQAEGHIPANKNIGAIAVRLDRANMKDTALVIDFILMPNEYFQTNYTTINRGFSDTTKVNLQQFRLYASSFLEKSLVWDSQLFSFLGTFSRKKVFLILELTGGGINELYPEKSADLNLMIAWGKILKNYLTQQKQQGNTVYEEDGTEMSAGPSV
jgi:hypothetical protein